MSFMYNKVGDNITITLDDDVTINLDSISSNTGTYSISTANSIDISNITTDTISTITLDDTHWADSITWEQVEFEDSMPSVAKVEDMCKDYPALSQAYEKFKTVYAMVHQDWKGKQNDDAAPF